MSGKSFSELIVLAPDRSEFHWEYLWLEVNPVEKAGFFFLWKLWTQKKIDALNDIIIICNKSLIVLSCHVKFLVLVFMILRNWPKLAQIVVFSMLFFFFIQIPDLKMYWNQKNLGKTISKWKGDFSWPQKTCGTVWCEHISIYRTLIYVWIDYMFEINGQI